MRGQKRVHITVRQTNPHPPSRPSPPAPPPFSHALLFSTHMVDPLPVRPLHNFRPAAPQPAGCHPTAILSLDPPWSGVHMVLGCDIWGYGGTLPQVYLLRSEICSNDWYLRMHGKSYPSSTISLNIVNMLAKIPMSGTLFHCGIRTIPPLNWEAYR